MNETIFSYIDKKKSYVPIATNVIEHIIKTEKLPSNAKLYYIIADLLAHIKLKTDGKRSVALSGTSWAKILNISENRVFFFQKKLAAEGYFLIHKKKNSLNRNIKNLIIPTLPDDIFLNLKKQYKIRNKDIVLDFAKEKRSYLDFSTFFVKINYSMIKKLVQEQQLTTFEKLVWIYCFLKTRMSKNKLSIHFIDQYKNIASFFSCSESAVSKSLINLSKLKYIQKEKKKHNAFSNKSVWKIKILLPDTYTQIITKQKDRKQHASDPYFHLERHQIFTDSKSYKIDVQENRYNNIYIKNKNGMLYKKDFFFLTKKTFKTHLLNTTFKKETFMHVTQSKHTNYILFAIKLVSRTEIFCLLLLWFMFILVIGTLAQKEIGLHSAQQKYFSSTFLWIWNKIPLPGGKTTFFLLFASLSIKLIFDKFNIKKLGTTILHLGVIVLLLGSFLTMKFSEEGTLVIEEGSESNLILFNNDYVITINDGIVAKNINLHNYSKDIILQQNFKIKIEKVCSNSDLLHRQVFLKECEAFGISKFFNLNEKPMFAETENNKTGIIFSTYFDNVKKVYYLLEELCNNQTFELGDKTYTISLNKNTKTLPFNLHLMKFEKDVYAGTDNAKSYRSKLLIKEPNGIVWNANVEMNKPLRYKGYTFYQTSFIENNFGSITILSVVKNFGNDFFYLSGVIMFLGLVVHLFNFLQKRPFIKI